MSNTAETTTEADQSVCANCGVAEIDDIKLEECDGCDLVKYCSNKCKEEHQEQHEQPPWRVPYLFLADAARWKQVSFSSVLLQTNLQRLCLRQYDK